MGGFSKSKKKTSIKNLVSWFEIPAIDFEQAVYFYSHIFNLEMTVNNSEVNSSAFFPVKSGVGGAIIYGPGSTPSDSGPLIYLNGGDDLNSVLSKVEEAGGRIVMQKTLINVEAGYFAIFVDNQGNKIALHSLK